MRALQVLDPHADADDAALLGRGSLRHRRQGEAGHAVCDRGGDTEQGRNPQELAALKLAVGEFGASAPDDWMQFVSHSNLP